MIFNRLNTSFRDQISGLYSEAYFSEVFQREWHRMMREKKALTIMIIHTHLNINQDKERNTFKNLSELVEKATKRSTDLVCRFHDNEIAVGLFSLNEEGTATVASRILTNCVSPMSDQGIKINLSIGALNVTPRTGINLDEVFDIAETLSDKAEVKGINSCELDKYRIH